MMNQILLILEIHLLDDMIMRNQKYVYIIKINYINCINAQRNNFDFVKGIIKTIIFDYL